MTSCIVSRARFPVYMSTRRLCCTCSSKLFVLNFVRSQLWLVQIKRMHKEGRPVLVGTTSVERSEFLAGLLTKEGIPFQLLNAKPENVERESEIVSQVRACLSPKLGS